VISLGSNWISQCRGLDSIVLLLRGCGAEEGTHGGGMREELSKVLASWDSELEQLAGPQSRPSFLIIQTGESSTGFVRYPSTSDHLTMDGVSAARNCAIPFLFLERAISNGNSGTVPI
jgi:hypothetical protein